MTATTTAHPPIASRAEWEAKRAALLALEKAATKLADAIATQRRFLPMTPVENYTFMGKDGPVKFTAMFGGCSQLIVQHFMFHPDWEKGCPGCTFFADNSRPSPETLASKDIAFVRISRAPIGKLLAYSAGRGWDVPWYSAFENTFNQDWGWTSPDGGEGQGISVYLQVNGQAYLTYSTGGRGVELVSGIHAYFDLVPYGRQEQWQDAPAGWPQK